LRWRRWPGTAAWRMNTFSAPRTCTRSNGLDVAWLLEHRAPRPSTRSSSGSRSRVRPKSSATRLQCPRRAHRRRPAPSRRAGRRRLFESTSTTARGAARLYACAWIGAVAVTTNARASDDDAELLRRDCGAVAGITQAKFAQRVAASCRGPCAGWRDGQRQRRRRGPGGVPDGRQPLRGARWRTATAPHARPAQPCSVQYTSAPPRGRRRCCGRMPMRCGAHASTRARDAACRRRASGAPAAVPHQCAGLIRAGLFVVAPPRVVMPRFSASRFWPLSLARRATWTSLIPFCVKALMNQPCAGTPLPAVGLCGLRAAERRALRRADDGLVGHDRDHHARHRQRHPPARPELEHRPPGARVRHRHRRRRTACGCVKPAPTSARRRHLMIKGVRGLSLFRSTWATPRHADSFTADGWFRPATASSCSRTDRSSSATAAQDMLKVGGENVAASEIERGDSRVPGVHECAVVGRRHAMLDEVPVASCCPPPAPKLPTPAWRSAIVAACRAQHGRLQVPAMRSGW